MSFTLELEGYEYKPGDWIRGRVYVQEATRCRELRAVLTLREETDDYKTVAFSLPTTVGAGDLQAGAVHEFSIQVPPDAYPSIDVGVGRLVWQVVARADSFGPDKTAAQPILILAR